MSATRCFHDKSYKRYEIQHELPTEYRSAVYDSYAKDWGRFFLTKHAFGQYFLFKINFTVEINFS